MTIFTRIVLATILLGVASHSTFAQKPDQPDAAKILHKLEKLQVVGNALYIAAHPDDENTRLIAHLSNDRKVNTTYLSLTRGDGGQNLIGPEISELLGVIRTQELLAARRIDGGQQLFSRANDFGYSKHPDETFNIWDEDKVLADMIWGIRKTRPDIIVNRFDHRSPGRTHGHHTASAMLSVKAFDLAADPNIFPEQLKYVDVWQPKRLFFNTSWWFYGSREKFEEADKSNMVEVDCGTYYPLMGRSNNEIAAASRSMHKCQGFGTLGTRGKMPEFLEYIKGEELGNLNDPFGGLDISWKRIEGGQQVGEALKAIESAFDPRVPWKSIPALIQVYQSIQALEANPWKDQKLKETQELILDCAGLYAELTSSEYNKMPGERVDLSLELTSRAPINISVKSMKLLSWDTVFSTPAPVPFNESWSWKRQLIIPEDTPFTNAYWLQKEHSLGMYEVNEQQLIGLPESNRLRMNLEINLDGLETQLDIPLIFKRRDPVMGEVYRPFEITPPAFVALDSKVKLFADNEAQKVKVSVGALSPKVKGRLKLQAAADWKIEPAFQMVEIGQKGKTVEYEFTLTPPAKQSEAILKASIEINGRQYHQELHDIDYDHIPRQMVLMPAQARLVKLDIHTPELTIGYIQGAGDAVPHYLRQIGYEVTELDPESVNLNALRPFSTVVLGIRAFNTLERIKFFRNDLMQYVEEGGTLVVQYTTTRGLKTDEIGPYPIKLSRERIAVEEAPIAIIEPEHPLMNWPNKITAADFDSWVQERGLYFATEWDDHYTPLFSGHDPGEPDRKGGLLYTPYGKGHFIYSGYSWFRELPAGVPGAYRIFVNLISAGHQE